MYFAEENLVYLYRPMLFVFRAPEIFIVVLRMHL